MKNSSTYSFEEMPSIMAQVVSELRALSQKVENLSSNAKKTSNGVSKNAVFVPSHKNTLNTKTVCKIIHKDRQAVYRLVAAGQIPYCKQGKTLLFFEDEIYQWLENHKEGGGVRDTRLDDMARQYCISHNL